MDAKELDKEFEATNYDSEGNIVTPQAATAPPVRRRTTVADLKKELADLKNTISVDVLAWCGQLDNRLDQIEQHTISDRVRVNKDFLSRIDALENAAAQKPDSAVTNVTDRLTALENGIGALADAIRSTAEGAALWGVRMEECEDAIHDLRTTSSVEESHGRQEEIEFAKPPAVDHEIPVHIADIAAIADVCLTLNDILMICRALKEMTDITDTEKNEILNIACTRAGEAVTPGMRIRAGIKYVEA